MLKVSEADIPIFDFMRCRPVARQMLLVLTDLIDNTCAFLSALIYAFPREYNFKCYQLLEHITLFALTPSYHCSPDQYGLAMMTKESFWQLHDNAARCRLSRVLVPIAQRQLLWPMIPTAAVFVLSQAWVPKQIEMSTLTKEQLQGAAPSTAVVFQAAPDVLVQGNSLFQGFRERSCRGYQQVRDGMPGRVWRSGSVQVR